jgi:hypothetical protein
LEEILWRLRREAEAEESPGDRTPLG